MFSLFKRQQNVASFQQTVLDENALHQLQIQSEKIDCSAIPEQIVNTQQAGNLPTRALGSGIDYAESRLYQPGDDPRAINWRLSARSQETFVKTYHIESRPSLILLLDKQRTLQFGTRCRLKSTQALRIAMLLAYAAELHHLDFQGWIINEESGLQHYEDIGSFSAEANTSHALNPSNTTTENNKKHPFNDALKTINQNSQKGSLVYLISDFSDLDNIHQTALAQLYERCFIQTYHVYDQAEFALPQLGKIRLQEFHQEKSFHIDTNKIAKQEAFNKTATTHFENIKNLISHLGIPYCKLATDQDEIELTVTLPIGQP